MKRMYMVTLMALAAGMSFPVTAMALLDLTVDFSTLPTGQGWESKFGNGGIDPDTQVSAGQWDMNNVNPGYSGYRRTDHTSLQTGTPTQYHGRTVIEHVAFSGYRTSSTEVEIANFKDAATGSYVWINAVTGGIDWYAGAGWMPITGLNNTSGVHTYDWLTTISGGTSTTDIWLDGVLVADDLAMQGAVSDDFIGFGDGQTNGPDGLDQHHKWQSFHIGQGAGEGPIPEPATLTLLGLGGGLMLLRRRA